MYTYTYTSGSKHNTSIVQNYDVPCFEITALFWLYSKIFDSWPVARKF